MAKSTSRWKQTKLKQKKNIIRNETFIFTYNVRMYFDTNNFLHQKFSPRSHRFGETSNSIDSHCNLFVYFVCFFFLLFFSIPSNMAFSSFRLQFSSICAIKLYIHTTNERKKSVTGVLSGYFTSIFLHTSRAKILQPLQKLILKWNKWKIYTHRIKTKKEKRRRTLHGTNKKKNSSPKIKWKKKRENYICIRNTYTWNAHSHWG